MILEEIGALDEWQNLLQCYLDNGGRQNLERLEELLSQVSFHPCITKAFLPLKRLKPSEIKVVIVGQDPYPESRLATGIAFSYPKGTPPSNSVENIFQAIIYDLNPKATMPADGNLDYLCEQGVFLINRVFTFTPDGTREKEEIWRLWEKFTGTLLVELSKQQNLVFLLWGNKAKQIGEILLSDGNKKLCAPHPSPINKKLQDFIECEHFSQTNEFLKKWQNRNKFLK